MRFFILLLTCWLKLGIAATATPLPAAEAFKFSAKVGDPNTVIVAMQPAPGYFLYRERFKLAIPDDKAQLGTMHWPAGRVKHDAVLGEYQVYDHPLALHVPVLGSGAVLADLLVTYQGCAESGFCYPPTTKRLQMHFDRDFSLVKVKVDKQTLLRSSAGQLQKPIQLLSQHNLPWVMLGFLGFGLLLAFTPCVLPMIPILSGIILGQGEKLSKLSAFGLSLTYVLSMAVTYAGLGLSVAVLGSNLQALLQNAWVISLFAALFVALALSMFGLYELHMPKAILRHVHRLNQRQTGGTYVGVVIMGILATLIVSPCVTPPLVGALTYIAQTGDKLLGSAALFSLGLGMGIPLIIIGTLEGKLLPRRGEWMHAIKQLMGILLLAVAVYLLARIIPATLTLMLWGGLAIMAAMLLGALEPTRLSVWYKLRKGVGLLLLFYGAALVLGGALGNDDPLQPLANLHFGRKANTQPQSLHYQRVKTIAEVRQKLKQAKDNGQAVMLDFYANWCISCQLMERTVFSDPRVVNALSGVMLLKADVTVNDNSDRLLQREFQVIAPPTFLFFDKQGRQIPAARLVGEFSAQQFLKNLDLIR